MSGLTFEKVFEGIDLKLDKYICFWKEICEIESPTYDKAGVDRVGSYFIKKAKELGWSTEVFSQNVSGDAICITMNPNAKGTPIALSGHMDTVHPIGSFGNVPVRIEEGKIYGPGVVDCKGGLVACFLAMHVLADCGFSERPVLLLLQSDEENGSLTSKKATINWMCEKAKDCAAFLNTEQHTPNKAITIRKGILRYKFTVKGRSVHSSKCASGIGGVNAIAEAAHKIIELEKLKDPKGITCNCGVIEGGTVANTVPDRCSFIADIRFADADEMNAVEDKVSEVALHSYIEGSECVAEKLSYRVAMERSDKNTELLNNINKIFESAKLPRLTAKSSNGGSDSADASAYGIPSVDGFGVEGAGIHSVSEFAYISSLSAAAKRLAAVAMAL